MGAANERRAPLEGVRIETSTDRDDYHVLPAEDVAKILDVDVNTGLSTNEASRRLQVCGENQLRSSGGSDIVRILIGQCANIMTVVLVAAMILSFVTKDFIEGTVIGFIVIANIIIGFFQEYKAERTMEALRKMAAPTSNVLRDGRQKTIPTIHVVPGDVLLLKNGDAVGADSRIFSEQVLSIDEALLTGESCAVDKVHIPVGKGSSYVPLGERTNMAFASTVVISGRGKGIVVRTGMQTEIGKIATSVELASGSAEKTPLQKSLDSMAIVLLVVAFALAFLVFAAHKFAYSNDIALYAVSLAIAVIPEGLMAVVTLTMAFGVRVMAAHRVLVRRVNILEVLGHVTNICSDKTGTLTQAKMAVAAVWLPAEDHIAVQRPTSGSVLNPTPAPSNPYAILQTAAGTEPKASSTDLSRLTLCTSLCNMAELTFDPITTTWHGIGEGTEIALQVFAHRLEFGKPALLEKGWQILAEFPFDSSVKRMSTIYTSPDQVGGIAFAKGAPECIIGMCDHVQRNGVSEAIELDDLRSLVLPAVTEMAQQGMRVLAFATRLVPQIRSHEDARSLPREDLEKHMTFLGLTGIFDPPRAETQQSIELCHRAGITVHMLTGDHEATAVAIAKQVGILTTSPGNETGRVATSKTFDELDDGGIDRLPDLPLVIARCSPLTKIRMVQALHRRSRIVMMTGDGVNDAPSLKIANVGAAMGKTGSDVTKQASDIVLTDDNFASIVRAVSEGRRIFRNIQCFISVLVGGNVGELVALTIGLFVFRTSSGAAVFPLSPVQILVNNFITGTPSALALGLEKHVYHIMEQPPRPAGSGLFDNELIADILFFGFVLGALSTTNFVLVVYLLGIGDTTTYDCNHDYSNACDVIFRARGCLFATLTILMLLHTYNCRRRRESVWNPRFFEQAFENPYIAYALAVGIAITLISLYLPGLNLIVFKQAPIGLIEWGLVALSIVIFIGVSECYKFVKRRILDDPRPA
ncbi:P-type Na(+) transporter [Plasmodiophora brassicae]